jgi:hypothetical protein
MTGDSHNTTSSGCLQEVSTLHYGAVSPTEPSGVAPGNSMQRRLKKLITDPALPRSVPFGARLCYGMILNELKNRLIVTESSTPFGEPMTI